MANVGTLSSSQSSSIGPWAESTTNANVAVTANSTATMGILFSTQGSGSAFNPNLPVSVCCPNQANIQGSANSGLPSTIGIVSCTQNGTGLTVTFANGGATANVNTNTRFLFVQSQGV